LTVATCLTLVPLACDADQGPAVEQAADRVPDEPGVVTHRVRGLAAETATSATDRPVEGKVLDLEGSREVSVPMGQLLRVELQANAGTGYVWQCREPADGAVRSVGSPSSRPIDRGVMGGRVMWILSFRPVRPGDCELLFELVRPWEQGVAPAKTASVMVHVTAATGLQEP
jgi:predicted secreted protein